MARICDVTGKSPLVGHRVSHANNKTKHRQLPNLQRRRIWVPVAAKWISLRVSTQGLRILDKYNNDIPALKKSGYCQGVSL